MSDKRVEGAETERTTEGNKGASRLKRPLTKVRGWQVKREISVSSPSSYQDREKLLAGLPPLIRRQNPEASFRTGCEATLSEQPSFAAYCWYTSKWRW